jgi:HCOMODA/2-hydroxy-3-carboxy-muconic semialdehyde decarboxylase
VAVPESRRRLKARTRRDFLRAGAALAALGGVLPGRAPAQRAGEPVTALPPLPEFRKLVAANRILAHEGVVDAFGHVSVRDPRDATRFVLSRSRSPALVELADLMEFTLDGAAVDARGRTPYGERMIHAAVYAARPDVVSVVHHHAYGVLPFTITDEPLRPVVHTASVIGTEIPVWDIRTKFGGTDMLVRSLEQGRDLAATLADHTCVLIRGHGAVVVGTSIERAVLTAIYLEVNAKVLLGALPLGTTEGLSAEEIAKSSAAQFSPLALDRSWEYFCQRAGVDPG